MKPRSLRAFGQVTAIASLVAIQLGLIAMVFGRFIPSTYNWFLHWATIDKSQETYVDFFYPFPPVSLWLHGTLPNRFSDPLFAEQILASIIWIAFVLAIFFTMRIWFSVAISFSSTLVTSIAYFTKPNNIIAGYFESGSMLLISALALVIYTIRYDAPIKRRVICLFVAGLLFSASTLIKQTFAIPVIVALISFCYLSIRGNKRENLRFSRADCLILLTGTLLPIVLMGIWLTKSGSISPFLSQVLSGSAKDPNPDRFLDWTFGSLISTGSLLASVLVLGSSLSLARNRFSKENEKNKHFYGASFLLVGLIAITAPNILFAQKLELFGLITIYLVFAVFSFYFYWLQSIGYQKSISGNNHVLKLILIVGVACLIGFKFASGPSNILASGGWSFLLTVGGITLFTVIFVLSLSQQRHYNLWIQEGNQQLTILWFVVIAAHVFAGSLSGGLSLEILFPASTFAVALIAHSLLATSKNLLIIVLPATTLICISMVSFQLHSPYMWWGVNEPSITSISGQAPKSVEYLRNTKLVSAESRKYFSRIQNMVQSTSWNGTELVTSSKSRTLAGPNNAGEIEIFGLNPYELNCPVLWWDVCPENYLTEDLTQIVSDPPEIILWNMPPEWVQVGHEKAFRNGEKSNMRVLNLWIAAQSVGVRYELLGKLNLPDKDKSDWYTWILIQRSDFEPSRRLQENSFRP